MYEASLSWTLREFRGKSKYVLTNKSQFLDIPNQTMHV